MKMIFKFSIYRAFEVFVTVVCFLVFLFTLNDLVQKYQSKLTTLATQFQVTDVIDDIR